MATKDDIIAEIQTIADASGLPRIRMGFGATGDYVELEGERTRTGRLWEPNPNDEGPSPIEVQIEGLAAYLDDQDISSISTIKAKVNELIASYMQLKTDYNNSVVPTTAADVVPIP